MLPFIDIFGIPLPMYGFMAVVGFAVSLIVALRLTHIYMLQKQDLLFSAVYMVIGIIIGAKLVYFLTYLPGIIRHFDVLLKHPWEVIMISFSGYVFYGGLIGGAAGVLIYAKQYKIDVWKFADVIAPVIPLFHAFGRIGCFLGGCCYGVEYHGPFAVRFPHNDMTPELDAVERFPVQLLESGLNIILFIFLYIYGSRVRRKSGSMLGIYLLCYTVIRIVTELLRGDTVRGVYGGLSTSQIISILLLPLGIWLVMRKEKETSGGKTE